MTLYGVYTIPEAEVVSSGHHSEEDAEAALLDLAAEGPRDAAALIVEEECDDHPGEHAAYLCPDRY
ncbi:hypothetical protein [Parafrankia sp. EUN1f]|uniref:hypothetical protein n=1 Tax=Parafrankia sp. EUN1f TaxID=102897 RepID=UPI0001C46CF6|nr:hypothetical protein [Parafrankia sp. EUN1f]EFC80165.1 hypothetical protein FrEUN1fDRAFT_6694 [Parafrankia sp. EUN1f]